MENREELIKELRSNGILSIDNEKIANFILADRKQICGPYRLLIKKIDKILREPMYVSEAYDAKEKALGLITDSGLEK